MKSNVYLIMFCLFWRETFMDISVENSHIFNPKILIENEVHSSISKIHYNLNKDRPEMYCYSGKNKTIWDIWMSVSVITDLNYDQYDLFFGNDSKDVWGKYEANDVSWIFNVWNSNYIAMNPFKSICLVIQAKRDYTLSLHIDKMDYFLLLTFVCSIILFLSSSLLCTYSFFCYLIGIFLGICFPLLIPLYCTAIHILPFKRPFVLGSFAGFMFVFMYLIYKIIFTILQNNKMYAIGYCCFSGLIIFAVCYNFWFLNNLKTKCLFTCFLRTLAACFLFSGSYMEEICIPTLVILVIYIYYPSFKLIIKLIKLRIGHHLSLSEDYHRQGCVETEKALTQLREYCISSEFKRWKYVPKLQDPCKFTKFMKGEPHISEQEIKMYENEINPDK